MNEVTVVENRPLTKADVIAQKRLIQEVMESVMKKDVHYGVIPGCKKPSLYKPGSEAILSTFRIAPEPIAEDLSGPDVCRYRVKVIGYLPSGEVAGYGIGECSSDEEKYKWRRAVCKAEFDATPEDRKRLKYYKDGGTETQVRTNVADVANTVLKMAKKRAQIDLTLTATGASDVFDQDLEDLPEEVRDELTKEQNATKGKPPVTPPQSKSSQKTETGPDGPITANQAKLIFVKLKQADISEASFKKFFQVEHVADLPAALMNDALTAIKDNAIPAISEEAPLPVVCNECGEIDGHLLTCPQATPPEGSENA